MKQVVGFVVSILAICVLWAQQTQALAVSESPPNLPTSPVLITGYQTSAGLPDFIQLYNNSSEIISLDGWRIDYAMTIDGTETVLPIELSAWLLPRRFAVIAQEGRVTDADSEYVLSGDIGVAAPKSIKVFHPTKFAPHTVTSPLVDGKRYKMKPTDAGNYTTARPFEEAGNEPLYGGGLYEPPEMAPLRLSEILANARNCAPLENKSDCREFVELYNPTDEPIDASLYRLRLGYANTTPGVANAIRLSGVVPPRSYLVVTARDDGKPLDITASAGNVWLEDVQGLKVYSDTLVTYTDIGKRKGLSWAANGEKWNWAVATPGGVNDFNIPVAPAATTKTLAACKPGQYRSKETNRCRKIATAATRTPCKAGQYRSTETNRCRNIASAASSLKPCAANQVRNPETNRCRSATAASKQLKPCAPDQERNPETNRCRKKPAVLGDAAFAVEPIKQTGQAFLGWWALGGAAILAVGYAGWEWRQEVSAFIAKTGEFFRSRK